MTDIEEMMRDFRRAQNDAMEAAIERALVAPGRHDVHVWTWDETVDELHLRTMVATRLVPSTSTATNWSPTLVHHKYGERPDAEGSD